MFEWLAPRAGQSGGPDPHRGEGASGGEYDPVYGLPKSAVAAWLARNPALAKEYETELYRRKSVD